MKARILLIICLFLSLTAMGQYPVVRKCPTCEKVRSECTYKGKHPTCSVCQKIIGAKTNACPNGGKHPAKNQPTAPKTKPAATTTGTVNGHEWVDLGLPSGTKWATTNVGASSPSDYGNYYAWGETSTKSSYDWSNLRYCMDSTGDKFSKYVTDSKYVTVDGKKELDPSDDAAYVNWGSGWRMPSLEQIKELREKCQWTWTSMGGHNGYKVVGPNGNSLFLPAAGFRNGSSSYYVGSWGYYWSRSLYTSCGSSANDLSFYSGNVNSSSSSRRYGRSVRPVLAP